MSNHLAIATVTATLGQLVHASAEQAVSGATLQFGRPTVAGTGTEKRVFVYLFQVTPNATLRNADLPTRGAAGQLTRRPQAALDLHYLLAFTGDDRLHEPQRMLGAVARDLHARPALDKSAIGNAVASAAELAGSDLAASIEQVKLTPVALPLEEMSKLWSVLMQTPHVLALVYQANVVLLDALESGSAALPVLSRGQDDRGVDVVMGAFPRIARCWLGAPEASALRPPLPSLPSLGLGQRALLHGDHLAGDALAVRFTQGGAPPVVVPAALVAGAVQVDLPDTPATQDAFRAGVYALSVVSTKAGKARVSNALPVVLAPTVTGITPNPAERDAGGAVTLRVTVRPHVRPGQTVSLRLGDREVPAEAITTATDTVQFVIDDAPTVAAAPLRVRVDDAESVCVRFDPARRGFVFDDAQKVTLS
ncbi:MAG: DUF4255 domain-containing protein [Polyangiales bacterium]